MKTMFSFVFFVSVWTGSVLGQGARPLTPPDLPGMSVPRSSPPPVVRLAPARPASVTIGQALSLAYDDVTASDEGSEIRAALPMVTTLTQLLPSVSQSESTVAARHVCAALTEIIRQHQTLSQDYSRPASTALDRDGNEKNGWLFRENTAKRWKAARAQLVAQAAPAWQRLLAAERADAPSYSVAFQTVLSGLVAEERDRQIVRTATLLEGRVTQTFEQGTLVQLTYETSVVASQEPKLAIAGESRPKRFQSGKTVYVAGLINVAEGTDVSVFGHANGLFSFTNSAGEKRTVEKYNFYRAVTQ